MKWEDFLKEKLNCNESKVLSQRNELQELQNNEDVPTATTQTVVKFYQKWK